MTPSQDERCVLLVTVEELGSDAAAGPVVVNEIEPEGYLWR